MFRDILFISVGVVFGSFVPAVGRKIKTLFVYYADKLKQKI